MAGDGRFFINVSLQGESLPTDINAVLIHQILIMTLAHLSIKSNVAVQKQCRCGMRFCFTVMRIGGA